MKKSYRVVVLLSIILAAGAVVAQDRPKFEPAAKMQLQSAPGLPECAKLAVANGDPTKSAGVIYAKWPAGCTVPMHWHMANEQLIVVSGSGKMAHQGGTAAETLSKGAFVFMPAKHQHSFTCTTACEFYVVTDGAFDIHYVDRSGNEIPPEQAIGAKQLAAGTKSKRETKQ